MVSYPLQLALLHLSLLRLLVRLLVRLLLHLQHAPLRQKLLLHSVHLIARRTGSRCPAARATAAVSAHHSLAVSVRARR